MELATVIWVMGPWQWVVIGVVVLLLFGGKKIPELMRGLGSGIKEFKDASSEGEIDESSSKKDSKKDQQDPKKDN
ncbi:MAG: twin-arginine translocase TatA/TatE family subunit [Psychroflexus sp.]|nr:twin-arginine translocase TatA/TatE family subunit [Psychroflexus sp.]MDR9449066.1 twin-arginine translocase TatA/TatE family subunit [Psychroflexus sp.]